MNKILCHVDYKNMYCINKTPTSKHNIHKVKSCKYIIALDKIFITDRVESYNINRKKISIRTPVLQDKYI